MHESIDVLEYLLEDAHTLAPAVVLGVDKDVVWEGVGVLGGDWRHMVFVLLDDVGDFHDCVAEGSFYGSSGVCDFCTSMSASNKCFQTEGPTLISAWRSESNVQSPRLPDQVLILCSKPTLLSSTFSFAELYDNLAAVVLILVVDVGIGLANKLINPLFDKRL